MLKRLQYKQFDPLKKKEGRSDIRVRPVALGFSVFSDQMVHAVVDALLLVLTSRAHEPLLTCIIVTLWYSSHMLCAPYTCIFCRLNVVN